MRFKYHHSIFEKYRIFSIDEHIFSINAQNKSPKYFLKIYGNTQDIFSQDKANDMTRIMNI